jgi:hypothetical protein
VKIEIVKPMEIEREELRARPIPPFASVKISPAVDLDDLAFILVALLRADGHLCNVLTHVGSGNWRAIEQAIASILYPRARPKTLSAVARNILQLVCDNRGVTGPIMRSVFFDGIARAAGRPQMKRLEKKIRRLRDRMSSETAKVRAARTLQ